MASSTRAFASPSIPHSRGQLSAQRLLGNQAAAIGLAIVGIYVLLAITADWLPLRNPVQIVAGNRLAAPSWSMPLGGDTFGRDLLSRIVFGARLSLQVSASSVAIALVAGAFLGLLAGYAGGWVDQVIMRAMDVLFAFPAVLLALGIVAALGPDPKNVDHRHRGGLHTHLRARGARPVLALKEREFVEAARALGARASRIIARHILPNLLSVLVVQASIALSWAVLTEASLSFLGLSAQPPRRRGG